MFSWSGYAARDRGYAVGSGKGYAVCDNGNTMVAQCSVVPGYGAQDKSYAAGKGNGYALRDNTAIAECAAVQHKHIQDSKIIALAADTVTLYAPRNAGWGTLRAAERWFLRVFRGMVYAARDKGYGAGSGHSGYAARGSGNTVVADCTVMQGYAAHDKSYDAGIGNGYVVRDNTVIAECTAAQHEHIQDSKIIALAAVTVTLYATRCALLTAGWVTMSATCM